MLRIHLADGGFRIMRDGQISTGGFPNNAPHRLRLHRGDRLLWIVLCRFWSDWRRCLHMVQPDTVLRCTAEHSPGIGAGNRDAFLEGQTWRQTFVISFGAAPSQPLVGCTPDSRTTGEVGNCGGAIHGGQIFASAPKTAFPDLADLPEESSGADSGHRLFHRADGDVPGPVRLRGYRMSDAGWWTSGMIEHPTEAWTMQQMREAFPCEEAPRYVLRDRDAIYGRDLADMTRDMGMEEVLVGISPAAAMRSWLTAWL
jgi:hypothetical protein